MLRSTATIPEGSLRNTFSSTTGSSVTVTLPNQFATKSYVDGAIENIDIPEVDLSQITEPTITLNTGFLSVKNQAGNETQFEVNPSVAGFSVPVIYTDNAFRPS